MLLYLTNLLGITLSVPIQVVEALTIDSCNRVDLLLVFLHSGQQSHQETTHYLSMGIGSQPTKSYPFPQSTRIIATGLVYFEVMTPLVWSKHTANRFRQPLTNSNATSAINTAVCGFTIKP